MDQPSLFATPDAHAAEPGPLVAATDGSALGNPGPGGWAWYIDDARWGSGGAAHTTNNIMELQAVLEVLEATTGDDRALEIHADSQYVIDCLTKWISGWRRRGWKTAAGAAVKNREIIEAIDARMRGRKVTFVWVRGHNGDRRNEAADVRARAAAGAAQRAAGGRG